MTRYQLLPPLSPDEYAALREDIRGAGVRVPIDVDEDGNILDGHHRRQIADELGIECPVNVVRDLPEFAKVDYALSVNLARRHLDREGRKALVTASLKRDPRLSDRDHARRCGVSHPTVAALREVLEATGKIDPVDGRIGSDGKFYPAGQVVNLSTSPPESDRADAPGEAATADRVGPAVASPDGSAPVPGPADASTAGATGAGSAPAPVAGKGSSHDNRMPDPDPEREKRRLEERDRDAGREAARTIVPDIQTAVTMIGIAHKLGETDLITADMIDRCRAAIDVLEWILKGDV